MSGSTPGPTSCQPRRFFAPCSPRSASSRGWVGVAGPSPPESQTVGETREHEPYDRIDHRPRRDVLRGLASRTAAVTSRELKVANGNLGELPIPERGSARDRESMDET